MLKKDVLDYIRHQDAVHSKFTRTAATKPLFRLGGVSDALGALGTINAKQIFAFFKASKHGSSGRDLIDNTTKWRKLPFNWDDNLSYQLFLRATQGVAVPLVKAAQSISAFAAAESDPALGDGAIGYLDIIPCTYNIDKFNRNAFGRLREIVDEKGERRFVAGALAASGQSNPQLLEDLSQGFCVTKEAANSIRAFTEGFAVTAKRSDLAPGEVRPYPGKLELGTRRASDVEDIDTDTSFKKLQAAIASS